MNPNPATPKDYLWLQLRDLPYFRALMRAVEASYYAGLDLPRPRLDVGSGDGHFATIAFDEPLDVGIDPWVPPMREAAGRGAYRSLVLGDGKRMPFAGAAFGSALSNSVLEHIPGVEAVLEETARVLKPGAPFVFCGPNHRFLDALSVSGLLDRIRLRFAADAYRRFFNRISRHYNSDPPEVWQARLEQAGFDLERCWHYYSPEALRVTEWGHYFGLPALLAHSLTGRWIVAPQRWNLALTERYVRRFYDPTPCDDGVCTFYIARRRG